MIPYVTPTDLKKAATAAITYRDGGFNRIATIESEISRMPQEVLWLLSAVSYLISYSMIWKGIDPDAYIVIVPSSEQTSTVEDFIKLLRHYKSRKVTSKTEGVLVKFLHGCTDEVQEFFLAVLSRQQWLKQMFRIKGVRELLDQMNAETLYGNTTILKEGWHIITYPLIITAVPKPDLHHAVIYKTGSIIRIEVFDPPKLKWQYKTTKRKLDSSWLKTDRKFLTRDTFVLFGVIDPEADSFYPLDIFDTVKDYKHWRKKPTKGFMERQLDLDKFLNTQFLRQIKKLPRVLCHYNADIEKAAGQALLDSELDSVLICDGKGRIQAVPSPLRRGIMEGLWQEDGKVLGVKVWFNAKPVMCIMDFGGENNALLYNPKLLKNKVVEFRHFVFNDFASGVIQKILWDAPTWHRSPIKLMDGSKGYVERCPYCLRDDVPLRWGRGCCAYTFQNWRSLLATKGVDNWFNVSRKIRERRAALGWQPSLVNNVFIPYLDFRLIANDQGQLKFIPDEDAAILSQKAEEKPDKRQERRFNTPEELREWYLNTYFQKEEETNGESGDLCEVLPSDQQVTLAEDGGP